ncbi:hypothetical protein I6N96_03310 [Enterococcus sp. BWM-S5]|uniref:Replication terminator protein n=1 Tax=Enterococcus larvae TaxID=2794352 RepID=A0ABS4CFG6_9ENTE|nr:hypothetical protein [Enterococcus larvae]MBP1045291.1 hypothetical protein [Enterococcus larvae]
MSLNLSEINEGAIQEKFDYEMDQVFANILDKNTEATKKRQVTLTIDVMPDKKREQVTITCVSKSKLVPREETETKVLFGRNENTGRIEAAELKSGARGQMFMDPDDLKVKTDVGQPVDELEKPEQESEPEKKEVIDFQKRQSN